MFSQIEKKLINLYTQDERPWLIGFSGGKDSTMVLALVVRAILSIPSSDRKKTVSVVCTDTRVELPAIVGMIESTLKRVQKFSQENDLGIQTYILRPAANQTFWVNVLGRGYPPPNRNFRWCTQRMKIDPVTRFVEQNIGRWGEAILHLGARRAESATRLKTLTRIETRNSLRRHPDLPRVWISNPIEYLSTEQVWAYLLKEKNPWGTSNRDLYKLYSNANGGECPIQIDNSAPSCGNSRFGCWTCTVVERDKTGEGLLRTGDGNMEHLLAFREVLIEYRNPENGKRDLRRMNGAQGPGPLTMKSRRELLKHLLELQGKVNLSLINDEELLLIQRFWKSARDPDNGFGVALIVSQVRGTEMSDSKGISDLYELQDQICQEKNVSADTLRRLLAKVEEYTDSHRAHGLPDDLLNILKDDLHEDIPSSSE